MIETVLLMILLVGLLVATMKKPKNYPPGPVALPLLGNYYSFRKSKNVQVCWKLLHDDYGPMVGMIVPKIKVVLVNGWDHLKELLLNEDCSGRPDVCLLRDRFQGEMYGLIFKDGYDWKMQRRFTLHHFRNLGFGRKQHESVITEEAQSLAQDIAEATEPMEMEWMFAISAINITWCLLGGSRYERSDPILKKLVFDIKEQLHHVQITGSSAVVFPFVRFLFPQQTGYTGLTNGCKGILEFIRKSISIHQSKFNAAEEASDFIDIYLKRMSESTGLEDDDTFSIPQLEGLCMDLLSAGSDTTSSVMSFSVMLLCLHPDVQKRLQQEVDSVLEGRTPKAEDKTSLVLIEAFLMEVLRYRAPTPTFPPHRAVRDTVVGGYNIPKETILIPNFESILTDKEYWGDPEVFRPERFITEEGKIKKEERLISFGKGKRSCLGETLAKMTSFLLLVTLVQQFNLSFAKGFEPKDTKGIPGFTLAPPDFRVIAHHRRDSESQTDSLIFDSCLSPDSIADITGCRGPA